MVTLALTYHGADIGSLTLSLKMPTAARLQTPTLKLPTLLAIPYLKERRATGQREVSRALFNGKPLTSPLMRTATSPRQFHSQQEPKIMFRKFLSTSNSPG